MLRRLFAPLVLGLALVASSGCADTVVPAARVGDVTISNADFLDDVARFYESQVEGGGDPLAGMPPGTYPMDEVSGILQDYVYFELHNKEFEELGLELDDDLRDEALAEQFGGLDGAREAFSGFGDELATKLIDDLARAYVVQQDLGAGYEEWLNSIVASTDIEVNPRYGTWDPASGLVPPEGPIRPMPSGF